MDSFGKKEEIGGDPFATDIFAAPRTQENKTNETPVEITAAKPVSWIERLPKVSRSAADWDKLWLNLPPAFFGDLPRRMAESLAQLLVLADEKAVDFLFLVKREISRAEDVASGSAWWLTVGVEASEAEIAFEIDIFFAAWLVGAALGEKSAGAAEIREFTPSETAVLEFLSLNLTHEANRILASPLFKFRALSRRIPEFLQRNSGAPDTSSLLVLNWQTVRGLLPSVVKMYLTPESLRALQPNQRLPPDSAVRRARARTLPKRIGNVRLRLRLGDAELSFAELGALETGDIVLLENHQFVINDESILGRAEFFSGAGDNAKIAGELTAEESVSVQSIGESNDGNKFPVRRIDLKRARKFTIESFTETENPATIEKFMAETNDNLTGETNEESAAEQPGLAVENLTVTLRVEIEARRLTLSEIGNLRENQVLELGFRPTDEVNLLVDNQTIGRGELVAVEDRLGVRITKLLR